MALSLGQGDAPTLQAARLPPPEAGVNLFDSLSTMQPMDAVYSYNLIPSEFGLRTRMGYQEWVTGMTNPVNSLIPFKGETAADDALFAVTKSGIYPATTTADAPSIAVSFGITTGNAGFGVPYSYTNDNADKYLFFAEEENGLYQYDPSAGTWAATADITGVAEADLVWVTEHKTRLWFVERDTSDAWYLAPGAKGGAATKFALGNKFPNGGALLGIYNWSVDGGHGVDDFLVFVSTSGDVVVYQGNDVSNAVDWAAIGVWYIGIPPASRKIGQNIGGQLHLLSRYGLISVQDLVQGVSVEQATGQNSTARRVARALRNDMGTFSTNHQWDIVQITSEGSLVVVRPYDVLAINSAVQYVFNFTKAGWGYWKELPMNCCVEWNGVVYFGDSAGVVHSMQNSLDGVARLGTGGTAVPFSVLSSYNDLGAPGMNKKVEFVFPTFSSELGIAPLFNAQPRYDYEVSAETQALDHGGGGGAASEWGAAVWGTDVWGGTGVIADKAIGGKGMGRVVSVEVQGEAEDRATLLDIGLYWQQAQQVGVPL